MKEFRCKSVGGPITDEHTLTVSVFEGLLLFGRLGDDFDPLAEEDTDVSAVAVEHLDRQHEVLSLVGVGYVQGFGCAIILSDMKERGQGNKSEHIKSFFCAVSCFLATFLNTNKGIQFICDMFVTAVNVIIHFTKGK